MCLRTRDIEPNELTMVLTLLPISFGMYMENANIKEDALCDMQCTAMTNIRVLHRK